MTRRRKNRDRDEMVVKQRAQDSDTSHGVAAQVRGDISGHADIQAALAPLIAEQRAMSDRIGKLHHSIEVRIVTNERGDWIVN